MDMRLKASRCQSGLSSLQTRRLISALQDDPIADKRGQPLIVIDDQRSLKAVLKEQVNIELCDKQATSNRNSHVLLRPQKNGRLGAEPDTAILLRAARRANRRLFFFSGLSFGIHPL
jgi:hypothetical protein